MISPALLNLPARLRARGITVVEMDGWKTRDRTDGGFDPFGIVDHHDGMGIDGDNVPHNMIRDGQNGAQIWIKRNGHVYMLAAGRMWHAGVHGAWGDFRANSCNRDAVGIETDYIGTGQWPPALLSSWRVVRHELALSMGMTAAQVGRRLAAHKEIAPGRKPDPGNYDPAQVRADLVADLSSPVPPVFVPAPAPFPAPAPTPPTDEEILMSTLSAKAQNEIRDIVRRTHLGRFYQLPWGKDPSPTTTIELFPDMTYRVYPSPAKAQAAKELLTGMGMDVAPTVKNPDGITHAKLLMVGKEIK